MNSKIKYLIYVFIAITLLFCQGYINENSFVHLQASKQESINPIDTLVVYNMSTYVNSVQEKDNINEVNNYLNDKVGSQEDVTMDDVNIKLNNTKSLLNMNNGGETTDEIEGYIESNIDYLIKGYTLQIDDKYYYSKSAQDIEWVENQIYQRIAPNNDVAQELITDGTITPYKDGNREITNIELDNNISVTEGYVPVEEVTDSKEDLLYQVLHSNDEVKYDTLSVGETLDDIAQRNGITKEEIMYNNQNIDDETLLYEGEELIVNDINPSINVAYYYNETVNEDVDYSTEIVTDDTMNAGETKIETPGQNGSQEVTYESKIVNGQEVYRNAVSTDVVEKPVTEVVRVGTIQVPGEGTGDFIWPSNGKQVICDYYCYSGHNGIDIRDYYGAPIFAADNGTVTYAGCISSGYGCHVKIDHNNGFVTIYGHMKTTPSVTAGNNVSQGQVIGYEGATGNVTAEHLHFQVEYNGVPQDPMQYF